MPIYSKADLYNKYVQEQASNGFLDKSISEESYRNIITAYPSGLYTPNYFIRVALGVLTLVAIIFSGLLIGLMFESSSQKGFMVLLLFLSAINYAALEFFVNQKKYYNAGVDNLLMFFSAAFIVSAFVVNEYAGQNITVSAIATLVCLLLAVRFTDGFMSVLGYLALFVFAFLLYTKLGNIAKATAPFFMMIMAAAVYVFIKKLLENRKLLLYHYCCKCVILLTLLTFYAAGNYFLIKELSNEMFHLNLALNDPIPFGWVFWIFTFVIPFAYVAFGILKKDIMFTRTGLFLIVAAIFTFRHYYAIIPVEIAMLAGGALLISVSYYLIKYLKTPKHGFSFDKNKPGSKQRIDLKALIITQVAGKKANADKGVTFGGGSFGSGGAGGTY